MRKGERRLTLALGCLFPFVGAWLAGLLLQRAPQQGGGFYGIAGLGIPAGLFLLSCVASVAALLSYWSNRRR